MAGGGGAVDHARHQRHRQVHGSSQGVLGAASSATWGWVEVHRPPFSPRPAGWPAALAAVTGADASA
jgi:hypothetical protein